MKLVIVESPTKAKTIRAYLGAGFEVRASLGHIRDLPPDALGVDLDHDFRPTYHILKGKGDVIRDLKARMDQASEIYLATDPDREGEAIAWHILQACKPSKSTPIHRVCFHAITPEAIAEAFRQRRDLDMNLVNAQQARRILDRLVGYQVSPLLGRKIQGGLSAGRVQSVAVRLVVEREREIQNFQAQEFWTVEADLSKIPVAAATTFRAVLYSVRGQKLDKFGLKTQGDTQAIVDDLQGAAYRVQEVRVQRVSRKPQPPFITSTLQREASSKLGLAPALTMKIAQQLYEGVDIGGEGQVGLITYMRTDSPSVSPEAQAEAREYVEETWGKEYLPAKLPVYAAVSGAQEAHECIRPTKVARTSDSLRAYLTADQLRLYELIWRRFLASQMAPAVFDQATADIAAGPKGAPTPYLFRATGSSGVFAGYLKVYEEESEEEGAEWGKPLPPLSNGEPLELVELLPVQHFTEPPPRYNEATLIKELEKRGVGRPSTYTVILQTIQDRGYVEKKGGAAKKAPLSPTAIAFVVVDYLLLCFPEIFDCGFTAQMERDLDEIAAGRQNWVQALRAFYAKLHAALEGAEGQSPAVAAEAAGIPVCELCGQPMLVRQGKYGAFLGCSGYPECKNTRSLAPTPSVTKTAPLPSAAECAPAGNAPACPLCGQPMVQRRSPRGSFWGCPSYPECRGTKPLHDAKEESSQLASQKKRAATTRKNKPTAAKKTKPAENR